MIKILPWITLCNNCDIRLSYENEDILEEEHKYSLNGIAITYEIKHYIICPKCNDKVYLD